MPTQTPFATARDFLMRGLLAGLVAGFAVFAVSYLAGEPYVDAAIAVEEGAAGGVHTHGAAAHPHSHGGEEEQAVVSRDTQRTWGLLSASLTLSVTLGGLTGLAAAFAYGRLGRRLTAPQSTGVVAAAGFVALGLVPFLVYPANPPAVGDAANVDVRTGAYFGLIALSLVGAAGAVVLGVRIAARISGFVGALAGAAAYAIVIVVAALLSPGATPVGDFPADILWGFRRASLITQIALWGVLGFCLAGLTGRMDRQVQAEVARRKLAALL
ncbi:CbtA family protein [Mycolicibacterium gadium]|uniref:CbtA family protein n=1 Tax=Mycolicibacterium gadium TaxID=1794 RepID=A0ABT6GKU6_MYCGU|nr:CbtA family protein [Mycolicibacterium gadium]MDG5481932.1 CbtA family protein [Mycolicibacterium gadium]